MVGMFYVVMLLLLQFETKSWYKFYFAIMMPVWAMIVELFIGNNSFGHATLSIGFGVTTFLFFQERRVIRVLLIVYTALMYLMSASYTHFYGGIHAYDHPFDEMLIFINCLLWITVVFTYYESKMDSFIEALKTNNKELKEKKNELERFNYMASHDLKTPIRTITSFLGLINRGIEREEYNDIKEYSHYAITGAQQIQKLVDGIIEISRIKSDFKDEQLQSIDLNDLLDNVKRKVKRKLNEKEFVIKASPLPKVKGIHTDFEVIFEEIIENGIQYNNSKLPEVRIHSTNIGNELALVFKDNGIGIAKPYHDQIFQYFKRLHSVKEYPGTGLGLGLCKKIINKYDGRIEVNSDFGASATFIAKFPNQIILEQAKSSQLQLEFREPATVPQV